MNDRQNWMLAYAEILSLFLAYENLIENRAQTAANDVHKANDEQANYILDDLTQRFEYQNQLLKEISNKLDFLISLYFQNS